MLCKYTRAFAVLPVRCDELLRVARNSLAQARYLVTDDSLKSKVLNKQIGCFLPMKLNNVLVVYTKPLSKMQKDTLTAVQNILKNNDVKYGIAIREKLSKNLFRGKDMIIAVGGDGTFLMASHYVLDDTPMLGVNSDPKFKEGFFMKADKADFRNNLRKIINGKCRIRKLHRLEAYIGGKKIPDLALNEFYIAAAIPYHTARYHISINGKKERQKSSGILVSTAAGSYAWAKSCGGKQLPVFSDNFEYVVREPYFGRTAAKCKLAMGILKKTQEVLIEFEFGKGVIMADSTSTEYKFPASKKVRVRLSNKPVSVICFD